MNFEEHRAYWQQVASKNKWKNKSIIKNLKIQAWLNKKGEFVDSIGSTVIKKDLIVDYASEKVLTKKEISRRLKCNKICLEKVKQKKR